VLRGSAGKSTWGEGGGERKGGQCPISWAVRVIGNRN